VSVNPNPYARRQAAPSRGPDGLADVLERILDKGLVIAGDIQINLLDIELITIKVRLLLASADTAQQMGIDWWKHDPFLTSRDRELAQENEVLRDRVDQLESAMGRKLVAGEPSPGDLVGEGAQDVGALRGQRQPTGARGGGRRDDEDSDRGRSGPTDDEFGELEVDELILEHASGGPQVRLTVADEDEDEDAHVVEGVEELIVEHGPGGPELRVTTADLERLVGEGETGHDDEEPENAEEQGFWLDEETISSMTRAELQAELEARDRPISGNKDTLRTRLLEALEDEWETVPANGAPEGSETDGD
jgi:hypothetical protein